jgi:hypothetical protein
MSAQDKAKNTAEKVAGKIRRNQAKLQAMSLSRQRVRPIRPQAISRTQARK